ncbi:MAG: hypothetical protein U0172_00825 [Nitrospiraceae bacterium]
MSMFADWSDPAGKRMTEILRMSFLPWLLCCHIVVAVALPGQLVVHHLALMGGGTDHHATDNHGWIEQALHTACEGWVALDLPIFRLVGWAMSSLFDRRVHIFDGQICSRGPPSPYHYSSNS